MLPSHFDIKNTNSASLCHQFGQLTKVSQKVMVQCTH